MPGVYGVAAPVAIQPGDRALVLGLRNIPGFQGSVTPGGTGSSTDSEGDYPQTLAAGQASGPVVIASMGGRHPVTQRQLIWRVFGSGSLNVSLQVSIDDVAANYVTIDTYDSTGNSGSRVIAADIGASAQPGSQATIKNLGSARFIRVINNAAGSVTAIVDVTSM
jgi:hypothetical protein